MSTDLSYFLAFVESSWHLVDDGDRAALKAFIQTLSVEQDLVDALDGFLNVHSSISNPFDEFCNGLSEKPRAVGDVPEVNPQEFIDRINNTVLISETKSPKPDSDRDKSA